ncbi:hypothetical protein B1750_gp057 [Noumeavirus]|uniref:Uncharacterized protein n=1 Tax=Marseillevirus sp. TaxID=2809551 RepID=A0AA96EMU4_9VIRU|nr:hypothetical protein B1750_gp057 [Noumeavirus]AQM73038.1 hypothetical protein NMV_057 [Noumeavirus]QZX43932.1 hypothetical protein MarQu_350 [Marseillevirus sp.]WNL50524.1 hypothetical protein MarDSR_485 [Marseillevirus sp.]
MSFFQVIGSNDPFVLPGTFYNLRELLQNQVPQIQDEDMPELIDGSDDESGEEHENSLEWEEDEQDFLGEHLERLRTQIFQLSGYDDCFNLLCPCGRCDKYRGQPLVYQKPTFKTQVSVEDFADYSKFEKTQTYF